MQNEFAAESVFLYGAAKQNKSHTNTLAGPDNLQWVRKRDEPSSFLSIIHGKYCPLGKIFKELYS